MTRTLGAIALVAIGITAVTVEQTTPGSKPPPHLVASFDGLGAGFVGPQGSSTQRNPSDNSLAVGPGHVMQIINTRLAIFTKTGTPLFGPIETRTVFREFGGPCETQNNGDAVARYDQLAGRWLIVMPIFSKHLLRSAPQPGPPVVLGTRPSPLSPRVPSAEGRVPRPSYAMCYAISTGSDPMGPYYRYEFPRALFPDYPRPAVWPDGYYVPTSTGDDVIQKHACVVERAKMLVGGDAREQCVVIDGVNFLNNVDLDGQELPPPGAPNIMLATGGAQLNRIVADDGIYAWTFHVDWEDSTRTKVTGPTKIAVAPYQYLCGGQLTNCVPQPGTDQRLDAQGDKLMARVIYRRIGNQESIVAVHSVNTSAGGGGVRWYEFRLDQARKVRLHQESTYAPDRFYRWMASPAMDRNGNIGIGYSFGGTPHFAGQRFAGRMAGDPKGRLTLRETVLAAGEASQTTTMRWEDYTQTAMDPTDDCTIWYVGDYLKKDSTHYSTRIGAFRMPRCR